MDQDKEAQFDQRWTGVAGCSVKNDIWLGSMEKATCGHRLDVGDGVIHIVLWGKNISVKGTANTKALRCYNPVI